MEHILVVPESPPFLSSEFDHSLVWNFTALFKNKRIRRPSLTVGSFDRVWPLEKFSRLGSACRHSSATGWTQDRSHCATTRWRSHDGGHRENAFDCTWPVPLLGQDAPELPLGHCYRRVWLQLRVLWSGAERHALQETRGVFKHPKEETWRNDQGCDGRCQPYPWGRLPGLSDHRVPSATRYIKNRRDLPVSHHFPLCH